MHGEGGEPGCGLHLTLAGVLRWMGGDRQFKRFMIGADGVRYLSRCAKVAGPECLDSATRRPSASSLPACHATNLLVHPGILQFPESLLTGRVAIPYA